MSDFCVPQEILPFESSLPSKLLGAQFPATFTAAGERASRRLIEFLTAEIQNPNTRQSYGRAILRFDQWCVSRELKLEQLTPFHIAAYIEVLGKVLAKPSVKQHLAALRMLCDYLVIGQIIPFNPASAVRGRNTWSKRENSGPLG